MKQSKSFLSVVCIITTLLIVYGTAVILHLLFGEFLLQGGLFDPNYLVLALLCAVPFTVYLFVSKNNFGKVKEVVFTSGIFFLIFFVYANAMLVFSLIEHSQEIAFRLIIIFPIVVLILVAVLHFTQNKNSLLSEPI